MTDPSGRSDLSADQHQRTARSSRVTDRWRQIRERVELLLPASGTWPRALLLSLGGLAVLAVAVATEVPGAVLLPLALSLTLAVAAGLLATFGLDSDRARRERRHAALRRDVLRDRRRMRAREELVANLSHDLRNPLAIALGFSEMAEDEDLSGDERAQALSGLRRSLWEMSQMVENVLDGSADEAGALTSSLEPVDLEPLCADLVSATRVLLRRRPVTLSGDVESGLLVLADRQRLLRVLGNLLGNACKYTQSGEIRLEATLCGRFARIAVRDTGPGIAPDAMPYIFDRYRRAHRGGPAGVGLGLAIAHRLTERMGGTLEASSALGFGSTFVVTLPLAEPGESRQSFAA